MIIFYRIIKEIFVFSFIVLAFLMILDYWQKGFVSNFFEINYLIFVLLASGIVMPFLPKAESERDGFKKLGLIWLIPLAVLVVGFWLFRELSYWGYLVTLATAFASTLIFLEIKKQYD